MFFGTLNEAFIKFKESYDIVYFSSTDSTIEVESNFEHNVKKRKRKKRKTNLSLNQSPTKKRKFNYRQQVKIKKVTDDDICSSTSVEKPPERKRTPERSNTFQFSAAAEVHTELLQNAVNTGSNSSESEEVNVISNNSNGSDISPFVQDCIDKCKEVLIKDVVRNFDREGLLLHFMAFMQMISSRQLSVVNMAVLLYMEMALVFSLVSTTQMRYRNDTSLFWETVLLSVEWCYIMSVINGNSHCFQRRGPVLLDTLSNGWIVHEPETLLIDEFLLENPEFIKQRSDLWMAFHQDAKITGSTMYNALGMRSLKEQKEHYKKFIRKEIPEKELTPAMQHGMSHEVRYLLVVITNKIRLRVHII